MFIDALDIISMFDPLFKNAECRKLFVNGKLYEGAYCPAVKEVIDNKPTTIVKFTDGSKAVVKCSENDDYNLETAVIYALVKRTFCTEFSKDGEAICPGLGNSLKKIVEKAKVAKTAVVDREPKKATCCDCKPKKTSKIAAALEEPCCEAASAKKTDKKRFKDMTQEEKRAYWREQKRKARAIPDTEAEDDDNDYNW